MKAKRTLALWLLSAMFVVCSFFGMLSLNNKVVRAEATTPTWQQTLIENSNDGMIAFPTPIDNWKTSSSVISFDCDQPSVTITLLYSNMENYSHRATEKNVFSGTLVEASPSNYYHYEINASAFDVKGGGEYTGEETVYGFSNRGSVEFKIANLQVSGSTYEMPIKAVTISDLKENGKYVGDTLSLNGANTVYTYNSLLKSANNSVIFNFKFVANQWAVDGDGIQVGLMGKWATEGGLWLRPDKVRIIKDSGYVETITLAPNATYDIEYGRLAKMNGETFTGKFYFYVKINGELRGSYETTQDSMLAAHNNATTADLAQPYIWIQRKSGLANNMLTDPTTYERPEKLLNVSDLKLNGSAVGEEISSNGSNTQYDYDASLQSANKSLVFQFKFTPADPWTTEGDGFQMNLMGAWANEGGIWIRPDTVYLLGGGVGGGNKKVASPLTTVGTTYLIEYGRLAMTVNGQFSGHYYFYLKIDGVLLLDYIGEKESVEAKNKITLDVAKIWIQRKNTINHTISNALVIDYEKPADAVSIGDLSHGGSPVGDTLDFNDAPPYTYNPNFKTANHSLIFKFKFTTVNWVNNGDGGDGFQMGMFNAWPNTNGGGLWIRPDAVRLMANGGYVVGDALANDTTYNVEWGRLAIIENSVFTNKYYVYVKIDGELWIDCVVEGSAIGASNLEQTQLWIQRKAGYQSIMRDIDYAVITHETPANAVSIGDLSHGGSPVGDTLDFNDAPPYTYDSSFKTANHSLIFKFKFTTVNWVNNGNGGDGFQMGMFNAWPDVNGGGLWIRPDAVRLMANGNYVVGDPLANDTTYNVEWGRLAILRDGVFSNKYYVYVKIDGELWIDCEVEGSAIGASNLEQTQLWIQRKAGYQSIMRDIDYAEAIYETPDVVDVSDLLYNGLPFGGAYTIATTRFTIGKELTATNHSLSFRFVFNPKTWDENGSPQIHFIDSYSDTGFAWLKPNNTYIFKADGSYANSGSTISNALHLVEVGRLAKVSDADGSVMGYKFFVKIDGVTVVEYELASSEFASVSNLQDILNSKTIFITTDAGNQIYDVDYFPQMENAGDLYLVPWRLSASGIAFTASIESKIYNFRNITESGIIVVPTKNVTGNITLESTYENLLVIPASVSENAGLTLLKAGVLGILDGNICKDYTAVAYVKYAGADGGEIVAYSKPATTNLYEQISKAKSVPAEVSAKLSKALAVNIDLATNAVAGASISGAIGDNTLTLTGSSASYSCYMINGQEVLAGEKIVLGYSTYTVAINANKITLTKVTTETVFGVSEHYTVLNDHYPEYLTPENIGSAMDELGLTSYRFDIALSDLFSVKEGDKLVLRVDVYQKINALLSQMEEQGKTDSLAVLWYIQPYGHDYRWDGASNYVGSENVIDFRSEWYTRYLDLNEEAVRQVALLFPQVVNFEVWNEPELGDQMVGWNGSTLTRLTPTQKAQFLTDIMYRVNRALKSVNSDIILTGPSLCTFQQVYAEVDCTTDEFLRRIYEAIADDIAPTGCEQDTKADNYFDVVNIHPYVGVGNTTDSNWGNWLETIHQISVENGDANTPIWITEFGFNTNGLTNNEINSKASILSSKISLIKNTDYITRVYFYTAIDDSTSEQKWGLFAWDNGLKIKATGEAVKEALK